MRESYIGPGIKPLYMVSHNPHYNGEHMRHHISFRPCARVLRRCILCRKSDLYCNCLSNAALKRMGKAPPVLPQMLESEYHLDAGFPGDLMEKHHGKDRQQEVHEA